MRRLSPFAALAVLAVAGSASAFPWMVRHNYASCAACHVDPSGAGQLTQYGRAQSDVLLRWKPVKTKADEDGDIPKSVNFLWFLELPEAVNLSGNFRGGPLVTLTPSVGIRPMPMAADLNATFNLGPVVLHGSTGVGFFARRNSGPAAILPACNPGATTCPVQWIAREFWAGLKFGADDMFMLRAGRMQLPFGLRNNEHPMWIRDLTYTNVAADQQVGLALALNTEKLRGEVMGIAGNFQVQPDALRERGYSLFAEYVAADRFFVGASSLITWAAASQTALGVATRHAHGLFARWAPAEIVSLNLESNLLINQQVGQATGLGFAAALMSDFEVVQGVHLMATVEGKHLGQETGFGGWAGAAWYVLPHVELRLDAIYRLLMPAGLAPTHNLSVLTQLHFFL